MRRISILAAVCAVACCGCVEFRKPAGTFALMMDSSLAWKGEAPRARVDGDLCIKFPAWNFPSAEEKEAYGAAVKALKDYGCCARPALRKGRITTEEYSHMNVVTDFYVAVLHSYLQGSQDRTFGAGSVAVYQDSAGRVGVTSNLDTMTRTRTVETLQQIRADVQRFNDKCK